jgi:hypothetical protein
MTGYHPPACELVLQQLQRTMPAEKDRNNLPSNAFVDLERSRRWRRIVECNFLYYNKMYSYSQISTYKESAHKAKDRHSMPKFCSSLRKPMVSMCLSIVITPTRLSFLLRAFNMNSKYELLLLSDQVDIGTWKFKRRGYKALLNSMIY